MFRFPVFRRFIPLAIFVSVFITTVLTGAAFMIWVRMECDAFLVARRSGSFVRRGCVVVVRGGGFLRGAIVGIGRVVKRARVSNRFANGSMLGVAI